MIHFSPFSRLSLRVKLVLSYLGVALGAILILAFAVALAVQNYFTMTQLSVLRLRTQYQAQRIESLYQQLGGSLGIVGNGPTISRLSNDPIVLAIADLPSNQVLCSQTALSQINCNDPTLRRALRQASRGQEVDGILLVSTNNTRFSSFYVSLPLHYQGQIVGALFLTAPELYPDEFLNQVNQAIWIAGIIVSGIVVLFSLLLARRLTQPLESLTVAAEQMKRGQYTRRVTLPRSQDELGRLALTFNEMADTIEADVNALRRHEQYRRDLIANIGHDLATPLTAIQGFSEALADDIIQDPLERQETAQRIAREVQRLRRLVADMQQMSSLEAGRIHLDLAPLDMQSLVDETLAVVAPECEQAHITLCNEIAPSTPPVLADSDRLIQVLLNLLDNGRRHTPENGKITIGAAASEKKLHIWVSDTGTGIDPADLPHIFERFYRADRSRTGATGGSGLGLSIVKAIIQAHSGTIWAESIPGEGTRITFTLPLAIADDQPRSGRL
ncbi:MAG TPA: ATP-binding protein [Ktedonobacteraceae bacterium]|nr:ATP-binding protein [Ktedonobacteraceae bacterium]